MAISEALKALLEAEKADIEVQDYLKTIVTPTKAALSADEVRSYLESQEDGKKLFHSLSDSALSKNIETYKANNLPGLVEAELAKRNPALTPEQIQLKELQASIATMQREKKLEQAKNRAFKMANDNKMSLKIAEMLVTEDDDQTDARFAAFNEVYLSDITNAVNAKLAAGGSTPPAGGSKGTAVTLEQLQGMSADEIGKLDPSVWQAAVK